MDIAYSVPAGALGRALAAWLAETSDPEDLAALRLPPLVAGMLIAFLTAWVMESRPNPTQRGGHASAGPHPTLAQQYADALEALVSGGGAAVDTEVVMHVRADGCSLDDGSPIPETVVSASHPPR